MEYFTLVGLHVIEHISLCGLHGVDSIWIRIYIVHGLLCA